MSILSSPIQPVLCPSIMSETHDGDIFLPGHTSTQELHHPELALPEGVTYPEQLFPADHIRSEHSLSLPEHTTTQGRHHVSRNGFPHDPRLGRDLHWWMKTIVYQIYPRSFQDSTGNGIGDLQGIISRLDHFTTLGVGAIWLSPFYPSPQFDFGYDISDFCNVDPMFGTLEDFDTLIQRCKERDIKVIIDFVPGHTSHLHDWFQRSVRREEPYTDYYVWHDGVEDPETGNRIPPNNWLSCFSGTAWQWNEERGQFYYRPYLPQQPKLNYRCPHVVKEMENVVRFWLNRGVAGIRVDALGEIMEAQDKSLCEPKIPNSSFPSDVWESQDRIYTSLLPEGFFLIRQWKDILEEFEQQDGFSRFMVLELYSPPKERNVLRGYGGVPYNMDLVTRLMEIGLSGANVRRLVQEEYDNLENGDWPTFVIGNHDRSRISAKYGRIYCDAMNMLLLTLKGTPTTYYGEEIGMLEVDIPYEKTVDPWGVMVGPERYRSFSRDPCRTPMQWDDTEQAGFTNSTNPWLPVHPNSAALNAKSQLESFNLTPIKVYQALAHLRQGPAFQYGDLTYAISNTDIFSYTRHDAVSGERYLIALNLGRSTRTTDFSTAPGCETNGVVAVCTCAVADDLRSGAMANLEELTLNPGDGLVIHMAASEVTS